MKAFSWSGLLWRSRERSIVAGVCLAVGILAVSRRASSVSESSVKARTRPLCQSQSRSGDKVFEEMMRDVGEKPGVWPKQSPLIDSSSAPAIICTGRSPLEEKLALTAEAGARLVTIPVGVASKRGSFEVHVVHWSVSAWVGESYHFRPFGGDDGGYAFDPVMDPSGRYVMFRYGAADSQYDSFGVYVYDTQKSHLRALYPRRISCRDLRISPGGTFVSYYDDGTGELHVQRLGDGYDVAVAKGEGVANASWTSAVEIGYPLVKYHHVGAAAVPQPVLYGFNVMTLRYRVLLDLALMAGFEPAGHGVVFMGPKRSTAPYSPQNACVHYVSLGLGGGGQSLQVSALSDVRGALWGAEGRSLLLAHFDIDEKVTDKAHQMVGVVYEADECNLRTRRITPCRLRKSVYEFTDVVPVQYDGVTRRAVICLAGYLRKDDPKTTLPVREYLFYAVDFATDTWKQVGRIAGSRGLCVLPAPGQPVRVVLY